jgi:hypothetical protein
MSTTISLISVQARRVVKVGVRIAAKPAAAPAASSVSHGAVV